MLELFKENNCITNDLDTLFSCIPDEISSALTNDPRKNDLIEIIMDLGRPPKARFPEGEETILDMEITKNHLKENSDLYVLQNGYISITPLLLNITNRKLLKKLRVQNT